MLADSVNCQWGTSNCRLFWTLWLLADCLQCYQGNRNCGLPLRAPLHCVVFFLNIFVLNAPIKIREWGDWGVVSAVIFSCFFILDCSNMQSTYPECYVPELVFPCGILCCICHNVTNWHLRVWSRVAECHIFTRIINRNKRNLTCQNIQCQKVSRCQSSLEPAHFVSGVKDLDLHPRSTFLVLQC